MDLPLVTEATSEYYRQIYADPDLGPIFKGINMVVLRTHVSYFIHQLALFDSPLSERQLDYLRKVHEPIIARHNVTQKHYDVMIGYLMGAMRENGAQEEHLGKVQAKLQPLRDLFPPQGGSADGHVVVGQQQQLQQQPQQQQQGKARAQGADGKASRQPAGSSGCPAAGSCPVGAGQQQAEQPHKQQSWVGKLFSCFSSAH